MFPRHRLDLRTTAFASVGWLFADLLLVLTMLFLASTAVGVVPAASPTSTTITTPNMTPIPTALPRLDTQPTVYNLKFDSAGLLTNARPAIDAVTREVRTVVPSSRRAGIVIVTVGAPTVNDIGTAIAVGNKINEVLMSIGQKGYVFVGTSFHTPYFTLGSNLNTATVEVYFYESA